MGVIAQPIVQEVCSIPAVSFPELKEFLADSIPYGSLWLGVLVGILVGTCIDILFLLRAVWSQWIASLTRRFLRPQARLPVRLTHLPIA